MRYKTICRLVSAFDATAVSIARCGMTPMKRVVGTLPSLYLWLKNCGMVRPAERPETRPALILSVGVLKPPNEFGVAGIIVTGVLGVGRGGVHEATERGGGVAASRFGYTLLIH